MAATIDTMPQCNNCGHPVPNRRRKYCDICSNRGRVYRIPMVPGYHTVAAITDKIIDQNKGMLRTDVGRRIGHMLNRGLYSQKVQKRWKKFGTYNYYPSKHIDEVIAETLREGKHGAKIQQREETALTEARLEMQAVFERKPERYHIDDLIHWYSSNQRRYYVR